MCVLVLAEDLKRQLSVFYVLFCGGGISYFFFYWFKLQALLEVVACAWLKGFSKRACNTKSSICLSFLVSKEQLALY